MFNDKNPPKPITRPQDVPGWKPAPSGLGDQVERIAQPVAKVIDKVLKTNVQGCKACKRRRDYLNKRFSRSDS